jgi:hypothetical protein
MADLENANPFLTIPKTLPPPIIADGIASALENLAKQVRNGQVYAFGLMWFGGSTMQYIPLPEKPGPATKPGDVPVPDENDPKEKRRLEVAAY